MIGNAACLAAKKIVSGKNKIQSLWADKIGTGINNAQKRRTDIRGQLYRSLRGMIRQGPGLEYEGLRKIID